jgi:hypothetical protein
MALSDEERILTRGPEIEGDRAWFALRDGEPGEYLQIKRTGDVFTIRLGFSRVWVTGESANEITIKSEGIF